MVNLQTGLFWVFFLDGHLAVSQIPSQKLFWEVLEDFRVYVYIYICENVLVGKAHFISWAVFYYIPDYGAYWANCYFKLLTVCVIAYI